MKKQHILIPLIALLLAACDQATAPKPNKNGDSNQTSAPVQEKSPAPTDKPAAKTDEKKASTTTDNKKPQEPAAPAASPTPPADTKDNNDKMATQDITAENTPPAPPPVFKTAEEALPYIDSKLPYDMKDTLIQSVRLENGVYTFTAVIKGVEDAAAFKSGHDIAGLTQIYHEGTLPYVCPSEPFASLWKKKKLKSIHFDYQDEHAQLIMPLDIKAEDCAVLLTTPAK